jgi:hypothetical protein
LQAFPKTERPATAEPIMGLSQVDLRDEKKKVCNRGESSPHLTGCQTKNTPKAATEKKPAQK